VKIAALQNPAKFGLLIRVEKEGKSTRWSVVTQGQEPEPSPAAMRASEGQQNHAFAPA